MLDFDRQYFWLGTITEEVFRWDPDEENSFDLGFEIRL